MKLPLLLILVAALNIASAEESLKPFDWSEVLVAPPGIDQTKGNQILHFKSKNKPYWNNETAKDFVKRYLAHAVQLESDASVLRFGSDSVTLSGAYIELGLCTGKTANFIAALNPLKPVYGFDSFEGMPEAWDRPDVVFPKGTFRFKNPDWLPPVLHNVKIIKGTFADALPPFCSTHLSAETPIAFLHVDSDIYSSAATAFKILGPYIKPGTILVFDEFYNYPNSENHEFKAFQEFLQEYNLDAEYLAYNIYHEQVAVRITQNPK